MRSGQRSSLHLPGSSPRSSDTSRRGIADAAQLACLLEVSAPKPGNVNRHHDFPDTRFEDFLLSAIAIRPAMGDAGRAGVGRTVWRAVRDTHRLVRSNTNLGIVLLLAPLAKAFGHTCRSQQHESEVGVDELRGNLSTILAGLTVEDARWAYTAIRLAGPGGLGRALQADVGANPDVTLYQAMALAQDRDAIAREYLTDFAITFGIAYPALKDAVKLFREFPSAIVQAYLTVMAQVPDTLIARKRGMGVASQVSRWASEVLAMGGTFSNRGRKALAELDHTLCDDDHTLNPGTTADLITAAIFLFLLLDRAVR